MRKINILNNQKIPMINLETLTQEIRLEANVWADEKNESITIEVSSENGRHTIVRIMNEDGKIIRMFSWFLLKGVNETSVRELSSLEIENYWLEILDNEGGTMFITKLVK